MTVLKNMTQGGHQDREGTRQVNGGARGQWRGRQGEPRPTHPVLRHTGLELLDLGVWRTSPRTVPIFFLLPALALQLLELQVLIGTLGHVQLFPHLWKEHKRIGGLDL